MRNREQMILDHLEGTPAFSYAGLAGLFGVCAMTIRRDVERLVQRGAVIKTLGGIQRAATETGNLYETELCARLAMQRREKRAIARRALGLLEAGQTVFMDGGTTCLELAKLVACEQKGLTVVTNSMMVCREVGQNGNNVVLGLGGQYDPASLSFVGAACETEIAKFFPDIAIFSTKGFMPTEGTYESFVPTMHIKQSIARHSRQVLLLVDHTKFGVRALCRVLRTAEIDVIVTDVLPSSEHRQALKRAAIKVLVAVPEKNGRQTVAPPTTRER